MTLEEFIRFVAPKRCGVHQAYGEIGWLAIVSQNEGNDFLNRENFKTIRDWCKIAFPYPSERDEEQYEKNLDIGEMAVMGHYDKSEKHEDNFQVELKALSDKRVYTVDELNMVQRASAEFWSP